MDSPLTLLMRQKAYFRKNPYPSLESRRADLIKLSRAIQDSENLLTQALHQDFKKLPVETRLTEILPVMSEIRFTLKNLKKWMKPRKVPSAFPVWGTQSHIFYQPKGVCLILSPWNYPLNLSLGPLIPALAAGNSVILKPSELTPATNQILRKILESIFSLDKVAIVEGDAQVAQTLTELPFDHVFFTGSPSVGKKVMQAAAQNLTSITLELGGKSPVLIEESADLTQAAEKILWAKTLNQGQTCVAPDYILIQKNKLDGFLEALRRTYQKRFSRQLEWTGIIHPKNEARGLELVKSSGASETMQLGQLQIPISPDLKSPLMKEEIFGPILPILPLSSWSEMLDFVSLREHPLAIYLFTRNQSKIFEVETLLHSGGLLINDLIIHLGSHHLPFGGVGPSGMGSYHGHYGFQTFSHGKSVMKQVWGGPFLRLLYPPYGSIHEKLWRFLSGFYRL